MDQGCRSVEAGDADLVQQCGDMAVSIDIKVSGVWQLATPYIKVGGTWQLAQPRIKVAGAWN